MKLMNERLDDLRRELARETQDRTAKEAIKGLRWLLLHRRDNLEKDAARRLERRLKINQPLQCAYLLKEELGELWQQDDGRRAWAFLREWAAKATASGIRQLQAMAKPLLRQAKGILLPHRLDQRKDGRNQSQDSRSARQRLWLSRRRFSQIAPLRSS